MCLNISTFTTQLIACYAKCHLAPFRLSLSLPLSETPPRTAQLLAGGFRLIFGLPSSCLLLRFIFVPCSPNRVLRSIRRSFVSVPKRIGIASGLIDSFFSLLHFGSFLPREVGFGDQLIDATANALGDTVVSSNPSEISCFRLDGDAPGVHFAPTWSMLCWCFRGSRGKTPLGGTPKQHIRHLPALRPKGCVEFAS